jgi:hypothetical protein
MKNVSHEMYMTSKIFIITSLKGLSYEIDLENVDKS